MIQSAQASSVTVPPDVAEFAAEQGVTEYLPPLIELTRRVFPEAELSVVVEDDPEIPNDRHIVLITRIPAMDPDRDVDRTREWTIGLIAVCPAPLAPVFRLGLESMP